MTRTAAPPTRPPEPDGPRPVSRFEFNLVRVLRFFLGHFPSDQGIQLVRAAMTRPECLSDTAVGLVKDSLAKGCVLALVRAGGWRSDRYLRAGKPVGGRAWERSPPADLALAFSARVVEFLIWATAEKVHDPKAPWDAPYEELTPADELFFWLAFDACRADPDLVAVLRTRDAFRLNPLCWLGYPGDMAADDESAPPDFRPCFAGPRAVILECLQAHLARRWTQSERAKGQIGDWERMRRQGRAEFATLRAFLAAAGAANRTDLARFVLKTNVAMFRTDLAPAFWTGGLQGSGPPRLADRLDTQRAALAVPRQLEVLAGWQQRAVHVGYFDEDYSASQMWKQEWEAAGGDAVAARARAAVESLEPLRAPVGGAPPAATDIPGDDA